MILFKVFCIVLFFTGIVACIAANYRIYLWFIGYKPTETSKPIEQIKRIIPPKPSEDVIRVNNILANIDSYNGTGEGQRSLRG